MSNHRLAVALGLVSLVPLLLLAQEQPPGTQPVFKARTDAVNVDVLVTKDGAPLKGLTVANFEVKDNGVVQVIDSVSNDVAPLDVTCVVGWAERRLHDELPALLRAGDALRSAMTERDHVHVVPFTSAIRVRNVGGTAIDFKPWLEQIPTQRGLQPMRDAVFVALSRRPEHPGRRLVVVFSDGFDSRSWSTREQVLDVARRSDAAVHIVKSQVSQYRGYVNPGFLDDLADLTGGRVIEADEKHISENMGRLLNDYRAQYVVTFQPQAPAPGWHILEVGLKGASGVVMARRGYWVE